MTQATWEFKERLTTSWVAYRTAASVNEVLQNVFIHNEGALVGHVGTANLSGGKNWSTGNEQFKININGTGEITVTLSANCANLTAVVAEINTQLLAAHVAGNIDTYDNCNQLIEAYDDGSNHASIRTIYNGDSFVLTDVNAFTTLGWTPASYYGTDKVIVDIAIVGNGDSISTQADRRDIFSKIGVSAGNPTIFAPNLVLGTVGDIIYAKASVGDLVTLSCSGTSGVI